MPTPNLVTGPVASPVTPVDDASSVLVANGFEPAPSHTGASRRWRRTFSDGRTVVIGLVDGGHRSLKPSLVHEMIAHFQAHGVIPAKPVNHR